MTSELMATALCGLTIALQLEFRGSGEVLDDPPVDVRLNVTYCYM